MNRSTIFTLALMAGLFAASDALAKKARPASEPAPATQPTTKPSTKEEIEVGKDRAKAYSTGSKEVDKAKTQDKLNALTGNVSSLEKKLKESGKAEPTKTPAAVEEAQSSRRKGRRPATTQPVDPAPEIKSK